MWLREGQIITRGVVTFAVLCGYSVGEDGMGGLQCGGEMGWEAYSVEERWDGRLTVWRRDGMGGLQCGGEMGWEAYSVEERWDGRLTVWRRDGMGGL